MIKSFAFISLLLFCVQLHAQTLKVIKVKGKRAIVETTAGTLREGQTVSVGGSGGGSSGSDDLDLPGESGSSFLSGGGGERSGPRDHFIGGGGSFSMSKGSAPSTTTSINVSAEYGWNPGDSQMEYGIIAAIGSVSGGGNSATSFAAGGKFDYDFKKNKAPVDGIISVGGEATYGSSSSGSGSSQSVLTAFPMASYKWFILKTPTCVRFDAGLKVVMSSGGGVSSTDTYPAVSVGLFSYY